MRHLKIIILSNLFLFLLSCGTVKEGFSNQKKNNSDEFLVEKKPPLVIPPNYNELPMPKNDQQNKIDSDNSNTIKSLLQSTDNLQTSTEAKDTSTNFEKSIIKKIKKN